MESHSSFIILNSRDEQRLSVFDTNKEEWNEWPMRHAHDHLQLSCPSSRLLCFTQGTSIHVYHAQTNQCLELANIPSDRIKEGFFQIWHCSLCPDNQSLELVIYDEVEREVLLYNSGTGALDRKNKLDSGELELLMDVWPGWNSNTAYLLYCCCELATYDLASHELSFAKLEIPEGCISDASLDLNMSVVACKNNAFMVSYLLVGDCYHGEFDHIGIWKLDGEKWELVSKVSHSDGYDDEEMLKVEEEYEWRFSCCSDGFDKICIAIDKCEFMWMYSVEADAWRKLPSYPQAKTKMLDKIMFF